MNQQQILDAYRHADIVLFPTGLEGLPLAAAEAMACGTPVVATDCSSLPELIEDGVTGRLCPVDDVKAFAAAVSELAARPEHFLQMGTKAREAIEKQFSLKKNERRLGKQLCYQYSTLATHNSCNWMKDKESFMNNILRRKNILVVNQHGKNRGDERP
jgi:glycosyltransferase involved in cell wall biosynthesis